MTTLAGGVHVGAPQHGRHDGTSAVAVPHRGVRGHGVRAEAASQLLLVHTPQDCHGTRRLPTALFVLDDCIEGAQIISTSATA